MVAIDGFMSILTTCRSGVDLTPCEYHRQVIEAYLLVPKESSLKNSFDAGRAVSFAL